MDRPDFTHVTYRSTKSWGLPRASKLILISVENLEFCQNLEQNNQIFMRKSESTMDFAPYGESFEKAFISNILVGT